MDLTGCQNQSENLCSQDGATAYLCAYNKYFSQAIQCKYKNKAYF